MTLKLDFTGMRGDGWALSVSQQSDGRIEDDSSLALSNRERIS
jgi:hypothetical protein